MHFKSLLVVMVLFQLLFVTNIYTEEEKDYGIKNIPKNEFLLTKSLLNSDDEFNQKVTKELGKVSGI